MTNVEKMIAFYGSQEKWAQAWGVTPTAVSQWVADGAIPLARLVKVETLTDGKLKARVSWGEVVIVSTGE